MWHGLFLECKHTILSVQPPPESGFCYAPRFVAETGLLCLGYNHAEQYSTVQYSTAKADPPPLPPPHWGTSVSEHGRSHPVAVGAANFVVLCPVLVFSSLSFG